MIGTLLDRTGTLQRRTASKDAIGGDVPVWSNTQANVKCSVGPVSWHSAQEFDRKDYILEAEIYTAIDVAATTSDRWVIDRKYYPVLAYKPFKNPIFGPACYVTVCGKRNQS